MTRRGSLAYYMAAWVIGCFITVLPIGIDTFLEGLTGSLHVSDRASALLLYYFFALVFGALDALLFAFLLRQAMRWVGHQALWIWALSGAALAPALMLGLLRAGDSLLPLRRFALVNFAVAMVWEAPNTLREMGLWWQVPLDGAELAVVLFLVNRAFNRPPETAESETAEPQAPPA